MKRSTSCIWMCAVLFSLTGCAPNLIVKNLEVQWDQTSKKAKAEIANIGNGRAGNFLVYFNADENPVSQNRRPQITHDIPGLAKNASITLTADFAPLAHPDNSNLGNVYGITVIADPKNIVMESNENDNSSHARVSCAASDADVTTGTTGTMYSGQTFNETRAVDVTVMSATDRVTESLTLRGLNLAAASSASIGARIYDDTAALIASANVTASGGSNAASIAIPISARLVSGKRYRVGFYVETSPLWRASGSFLRPDSFADLSDPHAYTEATGIFRINSAHSTGSDSFPANPNVFVPQMSIRTRCP